MQRIFFSFLFYSLGYLSYLSETKVNFFQESSGGIFIKTSLTIEYLSFL